MAVFKLSFISTTIKDFKKFEKYFRKQFTIEVIWAKYQERIFTTGGPIYRNWLLKIRIVDASLSL